MPNNAFPASAPALPTSSTDLDRLARELIAAIASLREADHQLADARRKLPPVTGWRAAR